MKIMVCLISVQHVPNLLSIQSVRPDRLILAVTSGMKGKELQLLDALKAGGLDYRTRHEILELGKGEEQSADIIYRKLQDIFEVRKDDEWIINLTGGTKPMSIGAYEFSKDNSLKTLYISEGNQDKAIDLLRGPSVNMNHKVSTAEFLAGYGFEILNYDSLELTENRARGLRELATHMALHNEESDLRGLLGRLQSFKDAMIRLDKKRWEKSGLTISREDDVFLEDESLRGRIASQFDLNESGNRFIGTLERHAAEFLTGKWLEVFVWSLLLPFQGKGIWDVHMGVSAGKSGPGGYNDIDVSFMRNQSLCIIECKTGAQGHDPEANEVLYKIEAVKSGPKALRVDTYLATTSPNVIDPNTGEIRESLRRRSEIYGCRIIPGRKITDLAGQQISNDPLLKNEVANLFRIDQEPTK